MNNQNPLIIKRFHFDYRSRHSAANAPTEPSAPHRDRLPIGRPSLCKFTVKAPLRKGTVEVTGRLVAVMDCLCFVLLIL